MTALPAPLPPPEPGSRMLDADHNFFWRSEAIAAKYDMTFRSEPTVPPEEVPPLNVRALFVFMIFGFWCWVGFISGFIAGRVIDTPHTVETRATPHIGSDHLGRGLMAFVLLAGVGVVIVMIGWRREVES